MTSMSLSDTKTLRALLVRAVSRPPAGAPAQLRLERAVMAALASGADPNATTWLRPRAPLLHFAASYQQPCLVGHLLEYGADATRLAESGESVLTRCATPGAARLLVDAGAPLETLSDMWHPVTENPFAAPPLLSSLALARWDVVNVLLLAGADPNAMCSDGNTVFHHAVLLAHRHDRSNWTNTSSDAVQCALLSLLDAGANAHFLGKDGRTAAGMIGEAAQASSRPFWVDWAYLSSRVAAADMGKSLPSATHRPRSRL